MLKQRRISETIKIILNYLLVLNFILLIVYLCCSYYEINENFVSLVANFGNVIAWVIIFGGFQNIIFTIVSKIFDNNFPIKLFFASLLQMIFALAIYIIISFIEISVTQGLTINI